MPGRRIQNGRIFLLRHRDKHVAGTADDGAAAPGTGAPTVQSEERLVEAARAFEEEAWADIYRRHAQQVYAYIYFRIGDKHTAEDLAADVFVRAISGIKGYVWRGTPLLAWLYRIAHNVTVDYRKASARRMRHQAPDAAADAPDRRDELGELDERSDMMRAIGELTAEQQQVIILRFYQGMSSADVAIVMDKPEGAVKAMQLRAVRSLRRIITSEEMQETA